MPCVGVDTSQEGLLGEDSDIVVDNLVGINYAALESLATEVNVARWSLAPDAVKAHSSEVTRLFKRSFINIEAIAQKLRREEKIKKISIILPYFDDVRLFAKSDINPFGEDSLRIKVDQLNMLFAPYSDVLSWELIIADNTDRKPAAERKLTNLDVLGIIGDVIDEKKLDDTQIAYVSVPASYKQNGYAHEVVKGGTVYYAMNALLKGELAGVPDIVAFTDVDLSTDLRQLGALLGPIVLDGVSGSVGSRIGDEAVRISDEDIQDLMIKPATRGFKDQLFYPLITGEDVKDTQCGFKAFTKESLAEVLPVAQDGGWTFDTELLSLVYRNGGEVFSAPILWVDSIDASMTTIKTRWEMLRDRIDQYERRISDKKANKAWFENEPEFYASENLEAILNNHVIPALENYATDLPAVKLERWVFMLDALQKQELQSINNFVQKGEIDQAIAKVDAMDSELAMLYSTLNVFKNPERQKQLLYADYIENNEGMAEVDYYAYRVNSLEAAIPTIEENVTQATATVHKVRSQMRSSILDVLNARLLAATALPEFQVKDFVDKLVAIQETLEVPMTYLQEHIVFSWLQLKVVDAYLAHITITKGKQEALNQLGEIRGYLEEANPILASAFNAFWRARGNAQSEIDALRKFANVETEVMIASIDSETILTPFADVIATYNDMIARAIEFSVDEQVNDIANVFVDGVEQFQADPAALEVKGAVIIDHPEDVNEIATRFVQQAPHTKLFVYTDKPEAFSAVAQQLGAQIEIIDSRVEARASIIMSALQYAEMQSAQVSVILKSSNDIQPFYEVAKDVNYFAAQNQDGQYVPAYTNLLVPVTISNMSDDYFTIPDQLLSKVGQVYVINEQYIEIAANLGLFGGSVSSAIQQIVAKLGDAVEKAFVERQIQIAA